MDNDYKPTEYIVDFGDSRGNRFVLLNMVMVEQNGARLHEPVVRCRDCQHNARGICKVFDYCDIPNIDNGFCAWGERKSE